MKLATSALQIILVHFSSAIVWKTLILSLNIFFCLLIILRGLWETFLRVPTTDCITITIFFHVFLQIWKKYAYYFMFFPPQLTDGFSLKSEEQEVSSGLQDTPLYSSKILTVLWFRMLSTLRISFSSTLSLFQFFRVCSYPTPAPTTVGIILTFMFHIFLCTFARYRYFPSLCLLSCSLIISLERSKPLDEKFFSLLVNIMISIFTMMWGYVYISNSKKIICILFFGQILVCSYFMLIIMVG